MNPFTEPPAPSGVFSTNPIHATVHARAFSSAVKSVLRAPRRSRSPLALRAFVFTSLLAVAGPAFGATTTWTTPGPGFWSASANWDNGVPGPSDDAVVSIFETRLTSGAAVANSLTLNSGAFFEMTGGTLSLSPGGFLEMGSTGSPAAATATIDGAGTVANFGSIARVGDATGSSAFLQLSNGAALNVDLLAIGVQGTGSLIMDSGSSVTTRTVDLGAQSGGSGSLVVSSGAIVTTERIRKGVGGSGLGSGGVGFDGGILKLQGTNDIVLFEGLNPALGGGGLFLDTSGLNRFINSAVISGAGGVTKQGSGTLILQVAQAYTGGTTVEGGTVQLDANDILADTGAVTIAGGTLNLNGISDTVGAVTLTSGIITGSGTLTGTSYTFTIASGTNIVSPTLAGTGALTKNGTGTLMLSTSDSYSGGTTINAGTVVNGFGSGSVSVSSGATAAVDSGVAATNAMTVAGTGASGRAGAIASITGSNTISGALTLSGATTVGTEGGNLLLSGGLTNGGFDLTLAPASSTSITVSANAISGMGGVTVNGAGTAILAANNSYGGATTVNSGTLQIGNGGTTGSVPGDITNNSAVVFNRSNAYNYTGAISGNGSVTQSGSGVLTLSGTNTYTGATTVNSGTLTVNGSLAAGTTVTVASGATLNGSGTINGNVVVQAGGTLSGALTVNGTITSGTSVTASTDAALRSAISGATNGQTITLGGDVILTASLPAVQNSITIEGNGHILDGAGLYQAFTLKSGTVTIQNLTIQNTKARGGNGGSGGDGGGGGGLGAGGGVFVASAAVVTLQDVSFANNTAQGGNGGTAGAQSGGSGGGGLNGGTGGTGPGGSGTGGAGGIGADGAAFAGSGGAAGTGGGVATANGGVGGAGSYGGGGGGGGAATNTLGGGAGGAGGFGGGGGGGGIGGTGGSGAGGIGGPGAGDGGNGNNGPGQAGTGYGGAVFVVDGGTLLIKATANLAYSGNTTAAGTASLSAPPARQNLGNDIYLNGATNPLTFQIDSGTVTFTPSASTGTVGAISGDGRLAKTGAGTLVLTGTHLYTGTTTVSAGTLALNGSLAAGSAVTVASGATLTGTGTIGGSATIAAGGRIAPGNGIGTLNIGGSLTWNGSATAMAFELGASNTSDKVAITGALTKAGAGPYRFDFGGAATAGSYTLMTFASTTFSASDFSFTNLGGGLGGAFQIVGGNTLVFSAAAVPVITSPTAAAVGNGVAFSYQITASGGATTFGATGLPAGLSVSSTGLISGTVDAPGLAVVVTLSASTSGGITGTGTLTLQVGKLDAQIAFGNLNQVYDGRPKVATVTTTPAGLALNVLYQSMPEGNIVGPPTNPGVYRVLASVLDPIYSGGALATLTISPAISTVPQKATATMGGTVTFTVAATGGTPTYQWRKNGIDVPGATGATLTLTNVQPGNVGLYTVVITSGGASITSAPVPLELSFTGKIAGPATEVGTDIKHPNGNTYDQVLLTGASASVKADAGQVTRVSYVDLTNDIVQVEFSGAGVLTISLDNASGPAVATNYNQASVSYMKGHATLVITGADATTNLGVFAVGKDTAVNKALVRNEATLDGWADLAVVSIASADGKFGSLFTGNASYFAAKGLTGVYAPGVQFTGSAVIDDVSGSDVASAVLVFGAIGDVSIAGGDLAQPNNGAVEVGGMSRVLFTAGTRADGMAFAKQANRARLVRNGVDVTTMLVP